jgi:uncharacterized protein (TIGR02246 family)
MRQAILVVVVVTLFAAVASMQTKPGTAADEAAIRKNEDVRVAAWNKHDAKVVAATYTADADRITASGYFAGRSQIEKNYADSFNGLDKNSTLKIVSDKVRFLTADVAISDGERVITGRTAGTVEIHNTSIYVKRNSEWMLSAQRLMPKPQ